MKSILLKSSLTRIILFIFLFFLAAGCNTSQQKARERPNPLLLISFDGFRYDYLSKTDTPNFDEFIAQGVQAEGLIPVFPSKTFPNHYTIVTGLYPENSGLIGNTMYDTTWGEWYRIRDREAVENEKWYDGEPIWNTAEKQGLKTGTMFWVGSEAPIQNMRPTLWKYFDGSMPFNARIDTVVKWLSAPGEERVYFATLYFEHVDKMGHRYGADSDSVTAAIEESDRLLKYLKGQMQQAGLWDKTNILVVSDHGMINQSADRIIELDAIIDLNDLNRIIWSPVTMLQPKQRRREAVYQALKKQANHYRVFKKENLPERYRLKNHPRVFDLIMVADAGYTILRKEYKATFIESLPAAMHGYDPAAKEMQGIFMARGPAFKKSQTVGTFQNIHLYGLMAHILGLDPATNNGSLDSVKVMLK